MAKPILPDVPARSKLTDDSGKLSREWLQFFQQDYVPSGVTAGTYGDSSHIAQITVNDRGRVTAAANISSSGGLPNVGPGPGTFVIGAALSPTGSNGSITIDAQGRITGLTPAS